MKEIIYSFEIGKIINYNDGTFNTELNQAKKWCSENNAKLVELTPIETIDEEGHIVPIFPSVGMMRLFKIIKSSSDEQNEAIRQTRERLYVQTSDKLKADYDEAVARGSENIEELKQAWLESKDKIRKENPYLEETDNVSPDQEI